MKRIFVGCLVGMLLSASSLAVACDLSCGFAQLQSDCHSAQMSSEESMPTGMAMDGMAMPGTNNADSGGQQLVSALSHSETRHVVVGEMGPCERQSCDPASAIAARATHSSARQLHTGLAVAGLSRAESQEIAFHDGRDDLAALSLVVHSPFSISLRI